uniref:RfeF n=1 Tax=Coccidioides posadasii RMSCC 3488 TaxID=454284 RepID=A0A0J6F4C2_COCPO|nr:RfeF [Coccidioides posadasii RMSCC 3488]
MGLASKLAASSGAPPASYPGGPPAPLQAGQQPRPAYPGQQQYQAYPGGGQPAQQGPPAASGQQQPPQGQYPPPQGYPPQGSPYPGAAQYGAPPAPPAQPPTPQQLGAYKQLLLNTINEKGLQNMYPPNSPVLDQIVSRITNQIDQLCTAWRVPREVGQDIVKLALFDVILYIDDSGSMQFEENGERIKDLKLILSRVAYAASLFDDDGIQVRFMNSNEQGDGIRSEAQVEALIQRIQFKGLTPMGTSLRNKVLEPLVVGPARAGQLRKPVLIVTITDGQPAGEPQGAVFDAIRYASSELQNNPRYGRGAVSFQFAQVGNDLKAREFLSKLDEEPGIGELVDCTSNFEVEQDEMSRANPPVDLTPDLWLAKMILGAIDSSYDTRDEKASRPGWLWTTTATTAASTRLWPAPSGRLFNSRGIRRPTSTTEILDSCFEPLNHNTSAKPHIRVSGIHGSCLHPSPSSHHISHVCNCVFPLSLSH